MAGKGFRYEPDHDGIRAWALGPEMQVAMFLMATDGAKYLRQIAPKVTYQYVSSIAVTAVRTRGGLKNEPRAGAMIVATAPYSTKLELRDGYHLLGRVATYLDGRHRWYAMSPKQRASAKRRASRRRRKRASST